MLFDTPIIDNYVKPVVAIVEQVKQEPTKYTVKEGDKLETIATAHNTTVERLFSKNPHITHPDIIKPGDELIVPENDEVLPERPLPVTIEPIQRQRVQVSAPSERSSVKWSFPWGWCTWFASQQRPDLPVRGNAAGWIKWANSKTPQVGAVAVNTQGLGHVAIVTEITPTQVKVKHMNWHGFGVVSEDWVDRSYWAGYIL